MDNKYGKIIELLETAIELIKLQNDNSADVEEYQPNLVYKDIDEIKSVFDKRYLGVGGKRVNKLFWEDLLPDELKKLAYATYRNIITIVKRDNMQLYSWYQIRSKCTESQVNAAIINKCIRSGILVFDRYKKPHGPGYGRDRGSYFGCDWLNQNQPKEINVR